MRSLDIPRIEGADLTAFVPSCPEWDLGQLLRHLGGGHRWVETIVRTRATQPPSDKQLRDLFGYTDEDLAMLGPWLSQGAAQLVDTLRAAGPSAQMFEFHPEMRELLLGDAQLLDFWLERVSFG